MVGLTKRQTDEVLRAENGSFSKSPQVTFSEPDYTPPIYNVWAFGKKTNYQSSLANGLVWKAGLALRMTHDPKPFNLATTRRVPLLPYGAHFRVDLGSSEGRCRGIVDEPGPA